MRRLLLAFTLALASPAAAQPAPGPERFAPEIEAFAAADRAQPPAPCGFLFVGSSSIRFWRTLAADMAPVAVINRGFGGSTVADVDAWFDKVVTPYRPRAIVFYAGENDVSAGKPPAEVAADFNLYTKITGGQRIDLFGARLEQLPDIWKILVDAGFESGQAYGKSLRTVKSCVGSTWCRYGVQDAVAMAIQLELRYRGLRSPHKFKLGVSGCARECAEARSKDIGIIASELGWNLYVGGNGGYQPAHAQLLAQDLDDETLIRYIDRYLMYYIRTADRLQRTARWQEELEGGLDHVRDVVCDDSLGIAEELEAAMATHVGNYEDEWAATLKDPERLRRFRSFVNAPNTPDPGVVQVSERGQPRPARADERDSAQKSDSAVLLAGVTIPLRSGVVPPRPTERD